MLITTDAHVPIIYLEIEGHFLGVETPYAIPPELCNNDPDAAMQLDSFYFALAVDQMLQQFGNRQQFVWAADWQSVPALFLARHRHHVALTLHNTFDHCLERVSWHFGDIFAAFRQPSTLHDGTVTALEVGLIVVDVATTANRGFASGLRCEPLHQFVMARHIAPLLSRVVGINNASFRTMDSHLIELLQLLESDPIAGTAALLERKSKAMRELPDEVRRKAQGKVIMVSMGRRVSQKQHDVLVEAVRKLIEKDCTFPLLTIFATVPGDDSSQARLLRMQELQSEFPDNVICTADRLPCYATLMACADYNCMPSLYEPHGGAFDGTVVLIARAVDGLAEQICGLAPHGEAARVNRLWHTEFEEPTGLLFREEIPMEFVPTDQLHSMFVDNTLPNNETFRAMRDALCATIDIGRRVA